MGFEPMTPRLRAEYSTWLSYEPNAGFSSSGGAIRFSVFSLAGSALLDQLNCTKTVPVVGGTHTNWGGKLHDAN